MPRGSYRPAYSSFFTSDAFANLWAQHGRTPKPPEPAPSTSQSDNARPRWQQQSYGFTITVDPTGFYDLGGKHHSAKPKAAPQERGAVPADFPDVEQAIGSSDDEFVRVEVTTLSEMHRRFHIQTPFKIAWNGRVWDVDKVSGFSHDRAMSRFYLHVRRDAMRIVMVTA
jgi:hypothetical protein